MKLKAYIVLPLCIFIIGIIIISEFICESMCDILDKIEKKLNPES